ncbi:BA14K family protein [Rhizobium grahamii]|uniref:Lectin-like protein BA14k n=1 Tax=Rhizobium grahamii TaxID=1120045 RepID=A0A370KQI9_9HYPH|nr:BA14K family protein [Rhizobium grahamii]RDJ11758.1 hypothetical protein B5K06_12080 [Rhizobium grahamii]
MKAIATVLFGAAAAVGACLIGAAAATYILAVPEGQYLGNLETAGPWTSTPERVDPRSQKFERVAPLVSAAYPITPVVPKPKTDPATEATSQGMSADSGDTSLRNDHEQWCASRYRSYNPASDTYRSYSGQIRTCVSPFAAPSTEVTGSVSNGNTNHVVWCSGRYASYRTDDNTYQPYGGPRRECVSPFPEGSSIITVSQ